MLNPYRALLDLLPGDPLLVGDVLFVSDGIATIEMPGGGTVQARGEATVGDRVYFQGGAIQGPAPATAFVSIEV